MCRWIDVMTESSEARLDESDDQKQPVTAIRGGSVGKLMERENLLSSELIFFSFYL